MLGVRAGPVLEPPAPDDTPPLLPGAVSVPSAPLSNGPTPVPPGCPSAIANPPGSSAMEPTPPKLDSAPACGPPLAWLSPLEGGVTRPVDDVVGWIGLGIRKVLELFA